MKLTAIRIITREQYCSTPR